MSERQFLVTNDALAEAGIRAGCKHYFGYPITPASEITEYYAARMSGGKGVFVQCETEVSGMNMVAGVASTGKRVMMATSGPGISLGSEAISFMACAELPAVIVNIMRPGPGDGEITAAQGDYFQAVKGAGHGDYSLIVLAPFSSQETVDLTVEAFDLAEKYRNPVLILSDAMLAKMMESVQLPDYQDTKKEFDWALTGAAGRVPNAITTCGTGSEQFEKVVMHLQEKYQAIAEREQKWESYLAEDAELVIVAFGIVSRIVLSVITKARTNGLRVGMVRPITLWPFPTKAFAELKNRDYLVVELNAGQMVEDVKLAVDNKDRVSFYGRLGGMTPTPNEIYKKVVEIYKAQDN
jgi:2-oxoglutarate ferredoxin oxidoreductase subunit alpha